MYPVKKKVWLTLEAVLMVGAILVMKSAGNSVEEA